MNITPETTDQEIFDYVAHCLIMQGSQSIVKKEGESCAYRGPQGKKCAVGFLIKDEEYSPDIEGSTIDDLILNYPRFNAMVKHVRLLLELQHFHDRSYNWESFELFKNKLSSIMEPLNINVSILDKYEDFGKPKT